MGRRGERKGSIGVGTGGEGSIGEGREGKGSIGEGREGKGSIGVGTGGQDAERSAELTNALEGLVCEKQIALFLSQ